MSNKKNLVFIFLIGTFGYLLGTIVYELVSGVSNATMHISGLISAIILGGLYWLYLKRKFPKVLEDMKIEQDDEREKMIREKAGHCTLYFVFASTFVISILALMTDHLIVGLICGLIYIVLLTIYLILLYYFKRKI